MRRLPLLVLALAIAGPVPARAFELAILDERPLRLDLTASTIASWHSDNRNSVVYDDAYGDLINRIDLQLSYWKLVGALRLDTATYGHVPDATGLAYANAENPNDLEEVQGLQRTYWENLRSRYRDAYDLGKAYLTYSSPHLEITAGDSYVSFGRGMVLSMLKEDALGVDTTLLGAKASARADWASLTAIAGIAHPSMVDQASGESLYPLDPSEADLAAGRENGSPVIGQDRLYGAQAELMQWGGTLGLRGVRLDRTEKIGSSLGARGADTVDALGASLLAPLPRQIGSAYVEGAWQRWNGKNIDGSPYDGSGYALYGSLDAGAGPINGQLELQHYRDWEPLMASLDARRVPSFSGMRYSAPPTTEPVTADTRYGFFDRCVTGGRARIDANVADPLTAWAAFGQWATWGERSGLCITSGPEAMRNDVSDASAGLELVFDGYDSKVDASGGHRRDVSAEVDQIYYREWHGELSVIKQITGPWSAELDVRERRRYNAAENKPSPLDGAKPWMEGEVYLSLKYSPKLGVAFGFEHTSLAGEPPRYFNGMVTWSYLPDASLQLLAGQQRGALKCVSGICRQYPPFSGVRLEWTQRY